MLALQQPNILWIHHMFPLPAFTILSWLFSHFENNALFDNKALNVAYQDFVIVLPGVVDNLPQYFVDFCFGQERTESNSQITINHPPVKHLQPIQNRDTLKTYYNWLNLILPSYGIRLTLFKRATATAFSIEDVVFWRSVNHILYFLSFWVS